jgi:hypothetical protein
LAANPGAATLDAAGNPPPDLMASAAASPPPMSPAMSAPQSSPASSSSFTAASPTQPPPAPGAAATRTAGAAAAPGAGTAAIAATPAGQTGPQDADSTAGAGRARLRLSFSADSWVDVHDAAGRRAFAGNGRANSVRTVAGIAPMRVYLGFASGVQLEINNRAVAIGPQFVAGDVARFEAGADGVLRRDTHGALAPGAAPAPGTASPGAASPNVQSRSTRPTG